MKEAAITEVLVPLLREHRIDDIEIRAAASTVHSIYNGIERVLVLVLKDRRVNVPNGSKWHAELLVLAKNQGIISEDLYRRLREYLSFRHFFRHSYGISLDPELLFPLVEGAVPLIESMRTEVLSDA
jgi:hypothetical protein